MICVYDDADDDDDDDDDHRHRPCRRRRRRRPHHQCYSPISIPRALRIFLLVIGKADISTNKKHRGLVHVLTVMMNR